MAVVGILSACGENGLPITDTEASEPAVETPSLGSATPDPFIVVPDTSSPTDPDTSEQPTSEEVEVATDPEAELPEFDENGVPYCD